jgi:hypothetical protein
VLLELVDELELELQGKPMPGLVGALDAVAPPARPDESGCLLAALELESRPPAPCAPPPPRSESSE